MFAKAFLVLFCLLNTVTHASEPHASSLSSVNLSPIAPRVFYVTNPDSPTPETGAPLRDIIYINDLFYVSEADPITGETLFPSHSALYIAGTATDGPLKIEIGGDEWFGGIVRVFDLTTAQSSIPLRQRGGRTMSTQGQTALRNDAFMDPATGKGIVADAWAADPIYRNGIANKGNLNVCHDLTVRILGALEHKPNNVMQGLIDKSNAYSEQFNNDGRQEKIYTLIHDEANPKRNEPNYRNVYKLTEGGTGADVTVFTREEQLASFNLFVDEAEDSEVYRLPRADLAIDENGNLVAEPSGPGKTEVDLSEAASKEGGVRASLARVGGQLQSFTAVGKTALTVLGVAGTVVGAVFVILDFVNHQWVGGAIGAFGLAAGIALGLAVSGPIGWIIGGLVAALFAILPSLFKKTHPPAEISDVQGILQWSFFGDSSHTGNEQCQKGTADVPGNPNCTALYGAGPLSLSLKLDNFDAIVFLIHFNQGYPMSLKEIAAAFTGVDPKDSKTISTNNIASINCNNKQRFFTRYGPEGDDPSRCNHPTYTINRDLITLPGVNKTATDIYNRIIPAPGGDCKLLAYPGDQYFPYYNVTISGLPDAIACGLTSALNISGVAVPLDSSTNPSTDTSPPTVVSNGTESTNGQNGAFVAPPPPSPFTPLTPSSYVCLATSPTSPPTCLPPGTYTPPKTTTLEIDLRHVNTLTLPPTSATDNGRSWSFALTAHTINLPRGPSRPITRNYTTPQSPTDPRTREKPYSFPADMALVARNVDNAASFTIASPTTTTDGDPDPVCCLFADVQFRGDALCLGKGGGDLPAQWSNVAQSVRCHGGGWVWLYAKQYGDDGAALVRGDVMDLKDEPYGAEKETFAKNVKAAWVLMGD